MTGIYSKYGKYITKQDVRRDVDPALIALEEDLGVSESSLTALHVYVSDINGDDNNDGMSSTTPVKTFSRVWELLPRVISVPFIVHIGAHDGSGYDYELVPKDRVFAEGSFIVLFGDGADQPGEDGFLEIESGIAGAGTTVKVLELASSPADEAYWGYTAEYTSGAALGLRRSIRNNTGALATLVVGTETIVSTLTPAPGDSYRVLRPSVTLNMPAVETINRSFSTTATEFSTLAPVHVINIRAQSATATALRANASMMAFGLELAPEIRLLVEKDAFVEAGVDGSTLRPGSNPTVLTGLVNPSHVLGTWNGWGISQPGGTLAGTGSTVYVTIYGFFTGFVCGSGLTNIGNIYLLGGRIGGFTTNSPGAATIGFLNAFSATDCGVPARIDSQTSGGFSVAGGRVSLLAVSTTNNIAVEVNCSSSSAFVGAIQLYEGAVLDGLGVFTISCPNTNGGVGVLVSRGSTLAVGNIFGASNLSISVPNGTGILCCDLGKAYIQGWDSITALNGIVVEGGGVVELSLFNSTAGANITAGAFAVLVDGGRFYFAAKDTTWTGSNASGGIVRVLRGGVFQQNESINAYGGRPGTPGTLTLTNNAAGADADGFEVSGGSTAYLRGGSDTIVNANGYGVDARSGGKVYFGAQPSSVVGATADLIVDTVAGGQADTTLSASESAIVNTTTNNGSIIARSN